MKPAEVKIETVFHQLRQLSPSFFSEGLFDYHASQHNPAEGHINLRAGNAEKTTSFGCSFLQTARGNVGVKIYGHRWQRLHLDCMKKFLSLMPTKIQVSTKKNGFDFILPADDLRTSLLDLLTVLQPVMPAGLDAMADENQKRFAYSLQTMLEGTPWQVSNHKLGDTQSRATAGEYELGIHRDPISNDVIITFINGLSKKALAASGGELETSDSRIALFHKKSSVHALKVQGSDMTALWHVFSTIGTYLELQKEYAKLATEPQHEPAAAKPLEELLPH